MLKHMGMPPETDLKEKGNCCCHGIGKNSNSSILALYSITYLTWYGAFSGSKSKVLTFGNMNI